MLNVDFKYACQFCNAFFADCLQECYYKCQFVWTIKNTNANWFAAWEKLSILSRDSVTVMIYSVQKNILSDLFLHLYVGHPKI